MKTQVAALFALALGANAAAPRVMKASKKSTRPARAEGRMRVVKHLKNLLVSIGRPMNIFAVAVAPPRSPLCSS